MNQILPCGARTDVRRFMVASAGQSSVRGGRMAERDGKGMAAGVRDRAGRSFLGEGAKGGERGRPAGTASPTLLNQNGMPARGGMAIFVPKFGAFENQSWQEFLWKELREGGMFAKYMEREKAMSARRMRAVKQSQEGVKRNFKSDFQMKAAVPIREYFRWKAEDPHFWEDDANLKSWRRDNPDAVVNV